MCVCVTMYATDTYTQGLDTSQLMRLHLCAAEAGTSHIPHVPPLRVFVMPLQYRCAKSCNRIIWDNGQLCYSTMFNFSHFQHTSHYEKCVGAATFTNGIWEPPLQGTSSMQCSTFI